MENIVSYIRKPLIKNQLTGIGFKKIFKLYLIYLLSITFLSAPLGIVLKITTISYWEFEVSWKLVFYGVILAPILEEILFRILLRPTLRSLIIFNLCGISVLGISLYNNSLIFFLLFASIIIVWNSIYYSAKHLNFNFEKHFSKIFYSSALLFAITHIDNYNGISGYLILLSPIIILPYFFMGLYLGYIRMNFGIKYSILFHTLINFPLFFLLLFK